ncbi:hypothetical protein L4D08_06720 [Photobacterium chitinilyticum]|uniref:hypothetical protein n=1 Tax=Photobacterium chitinilyticum TaxID=2485123 RepID=UPI003D1451D5
MKIVYFSPVSINSYEQRPHFFVSELLKYNHEVLWVEPYPTRLPELKDLNIQRKSEVSLMAGLDKVLIEKPHALPIEPLSMFDFLNDILWERTLTSIRNFDPDLIIAGKPSKLANKVAKSFSDIRLIFDYMDDFSDFYTGVSKSSMKYQLDNILNNADMVIASSDTLFNKVDRNKLNTIKVLNGYKSDTLPDAETQQVTDDFRFVYIGSIANWFCWESIRTICELYPSSIIDIIGPCHSSIPTDLPENINFYGEMKREDAIQIALKAKVGLIPFKINSLTEAVDPIKYYEYRSLSLPVVSSKFGEMKLHAKHDRGLSIYNDVSDIRIALDKAIDYGFDDKVRTAEFRNNCSWSNRFNKRCLDSILVGRENDQN